MPDPFFTPWIPNGFDQIEQRILIIGESCPRGKESQGPTGWLDHDDHPDNQGHPDNWKHNFMRIHVEVNRYNHRNNFFGKIPPSFLYNGRVLEPEEFWNRHAFTNIIPRLIDERPNAVDWDNALREFRRIVDFVKPQGVFVASATIIGSLEQLADHGTYMTINNRINNNVDYREMSFAKIPVVGIYHPASWHFRRYTLHQACGATERLRLLITQRAL